MARGETFKTINGHWDPSGNLTIAEAIKAYLVDAGYIAAP
jgi:hypothetical protein